MSFPAWSHALNRARARVSSPEVRLVSPINAAAVPGQTRDSVNSATVTASMEIGMMSVAVHSAPSEAIHGAIRGVIREVMQEAIAEETTGAIRLETTLPALISEQNNLRVMDRAGI